MQMLGEPSALPVTLLPPSFALVPCLPSAGLVPTTRQCHCTSLCWAKLFSFHPGPCPRDRKPYTLPILSKHPSKAVLQDKARPLWTHSKCVHSASNLWDWLKGVKAVLRAIKLSQVQGWGLFRTCMHLLLTRTCLTGQNRSNKIQQRVHLILCSFKWVFAYPHFITNVYGLLSSLELEWWI